MELSPGYKQTEVGVIPEDWTVVPFQQLLDFRNGINADRRAYGKGVAFINVFEIISKGHLKAQDIPGRVSIDKKSIESYLVRRGDIVFNRSSETQDEVGLSSVYLDDAPAVFGGFVIRGQCKHAVDPIYSGYAFRSPAIRTQIVARGQGAIRANIGQSDLKQVHAPLPPLDEQRAIAEALSDADALIESLDQLIAKKRQIKQGAMQELLTGKRRLPGFSGEWEVKRLGDIAEIVMGQSPSSAHYNRSGAGLPLIQGNADIENRKTIKRVFTTLVSKYGRCGDVLLSVRAPVGEVSIAAFDVCLGRGVCAVRYPNSFLYHALIAKEPEWAKLSKGSTFDSVNSADVRAFEIAMPHDVAEQTAIAAIVSDMDTELAALESRLAKARQIKQGMMQELLTGRIRLL